MRYNTMGTNYYWRERLPPHGEPPDAVHIGKASAGWEFSFHGTADIRSWEQWKSRIMDNGTVVDEYGEVVPLTDLIETVEGSRGQQSHYDFCTIDRSRYAHDQWKDPDGWSFTSREFS